MGSIGVNADPSYHYERMRNKAGSSVSLLNWCCAVHGSDKMALRARRVMARAKARAIVVASWLILWLLIAARWVRLVCDEVSLV